MKANIMLAAIILTFFTPISSPIKYKEMKFQIQTEKHKAAFSCTNSIARDLVDFMTDENQNPDHMSSFDKKDKIYKAVCTHFIEIFSFENTWGDNNFIFYGNTENRNMEFINLKKTILLKLI